MVLKMKGNSSGVDKVHCKLSEKSCSGKTNIRIIFFEDKVSKGTKIYDVGSIERSSRWGNVIRNK